MPASESQLLNRLHRGYAEEVRYAASLTRHLGLAARAGDRVGFATAKAAFEAAKKRCEALLLSIEICREMMEAASDSASRPGLSLVPSPAPVTALVPWSPAELDDLVTLNTNAA